MESCATIECIGLLPLQLVFVILHDMHDFLHAAATCHRLKEAARSTFSQERSVAWRNEFFALLRAHRSISFQVQNTYTGSWAFCSQSAKGHVQVLRFMHRHNPILFTDRTNNTAWAMIQAACGGGHTAVVRWIFATVKTLPFCRSSAIHALKLAASNGHVQVLKWLMLQRCYGAPYTSEEIIDLFESACFSGHLHAAKWLHYNFPHHILQLPARMFAQHLFFEVCKRAHVHVAKWLFDA